MSFRISVSAHRFSLPWLGLLLVALPLGAQETMQRASAQAHMKGHSRGHAHHESALPPLLPAPDVAMDVLVRLPQVRAAQAGIALAQARGARWQAGPHEWVAKAAANRRRDNLGGRYSEGEVGLETGVRWPSKIAADRQLGDQEVATGELAYADAWHEAARGLLADWFDALRELHSAAVLEKQAQMAGQQLSVVQRRVKAGEAAPLELLTAQSDHARSQAAAAQAITRAQVRRRALERQYAGLPAPALVPLAELVHGLADLPAVTDAGPQVQAWVAQILDDNHELELAEARARQAQLLAERADRERLPDPTLGVRATRERGGLENVVGMYVSLPLGSTGRRADANAALSQSQMAQEQLLEVRKRVEVDAWRTAYAVVETRNTWQQLELARERTQRSADLQARAYALGESPLADLLLARRAALEATLAAETAALDALQSYARLLLDRHKIWTAP